MAHVLVTGGSGFFGGVLVRRLLAEGFTVTNVDLVADENSHPALTSIVGDLRKAAQVDSIVAEGNFSAVFHCAAMLAHDLEISDEDLWDSNVDGTRNLAFACRNHDVPKLIFTSTNCLWASNFGRPVREDDVPAPVEIYGRSKLAAEEVLREFADGMDVVTLRCPTIIDQGRLGLLAILFEFIHDGRTVWVVGDGGNHYQFIYAQDLATACIRALEYKGSATFNVGSDDVKTLREVYEAIIREAGSRSRVRSLPKAPTLAAMKLAHNLKLSPLGPYHYRMIAEDFVFDTQRIKDELGWQPTLTNEKMMVEAYRYYSSRRDEIHARTDASAHRKPAAMGVIRLLKWFS